MKIGISISNYPLFRVWNEENRDYEIKRAQIYMLQGFVISSYVLGVKQILTVVYH
jgi:hypothetical protein